MNGYHHEFDDPKRPDFERLSPSEIRYVEGLEKLTNANSTAIVTNGKFPYWSVDRWLLVITFVWAVIAGSVTSAWFFASEWADVRSSVDALVKEMPAVRIQLNDVTEHLHAVQQQLDRQDTREFGRTSGGQREASSPAFGRDEGFVAAP